MSPSLTDRLAAATQGLLGRGRAPDQPLSPRLQAVFEMVPSGAVVLDVGTDHGWLPVHLVHHRRAARAIAADVNAPPLDGARARIEAHRLGKRIETRKGDGLSVVQPGEVSAATICGMGGRRIVGIVERSPAVVAQLDRLVVQPNTEVDRVRRGLRDAGLTLVEERLVLDEGRWYPVLAWERGTPDRDWDDLDLAFGPLLRDRADPDLRRFLGAELGRVAQALASAMGGGADPRALGKLQGELDAVESELARLAIVAQTISKKANKE